MGMTNARSSSLIWWGLGNGNHSLQLGTASPGYVMCSVPHQPPCTKSFAYSTLYLVKLIVKGLYAYIKVAFQEEEIHSQSTVHSAQCTVGVLSHDESFTFLTVRRKVIIWEGNKTFNQAMDKFLYPGGEVCQEWGYGAHLCGRDDYSRNLGWKERSWPYQQERQLLNNAMAVCCLPKCWSHGMDWVI